LPAAPAVAHLLLPSFAIPVLPGQAAGYMENSKCLAQKEASEVKDLLRFFGAEAEAVQNIFLHASEPGIW